jgi:hypothetical protein
MRQSRFIYNESLAQTNRTVTYEEVLLVEEMLLVEATELLITELEILELELDVGLDEDKLDEDKLDEDEEAALLSSYTERRFPAPQYSSALPPHGKLQSVAGAGTDPVLKLFPQ